MDVLKCDVCQSILEDPIALSCGNTVCRKHADQFKRDSCSLCQKLHHEDCQTNLKLSRLINSLNRAKTACSRLETAYNDFKTRPSDVIKNYFEQLENEVLKEKERVINQIEASSNECLSQIEDWREKCAGSLKVNPELSNDQIDVNSKIVQFREIFNSGRVSEDIWNDVEKTCDQMGEELKEKIAKLKEKCFLNAKVSFRPQFNSNEQIRIGIVMENSENNNSSEPIVSFSPPQSNQTEPSVSSSASTSNSTISSAALIEMDTSTQMDTTIRLKNIFDNNARRFIQITGHKDHIYCLCLDRTGKYIFTGSDDNLIKLWRVSDCMLVYTLRGHDQEISDLHVNYENTLLISGGFDKQVLVWDLKSGQMIYHLAKHHSEITQVQFSPKCADEFRWFISASNDGKIIFNKYKQRYSENFKFFHPVVFNEQTEIKSCSFSKGGSHLVIGKQDCRIVIFLMNKSEPERVFDIEAHDKMITSVCFANHSLKFLTGSQDGFMNVWSIQNNTWNPTPIELEPFLARGTNAVCNDVTWSCNDKLIIASICLEKTNNEKNWKNKIKVWTPEGTLIQELKLADQLLNVNPHPIYPHILLTGGHDGYVVLWNLNTGNKIYEKFNESDGEPGTGSRITGASWIPSEGERFVTTDYEGRLSIFGFGETPSEYQSTPQELYFNTDYDKLEWEKGTIIDQRSKMAPHLMPYGYLTDEEGVPHSIEVQRQVPGRENLTETDFAARVVQIDGESRINDGLGEIRNQSECIKYLIERLPNDLLRSSESIRLANIRDEEEVVRNGLTNLIQVKIECLNKENSIQKRQVSNVDLNESNKRKKI